jgi:hypothetical protein
MKVVTLNSIVAVIRARRGYKGFLHKFIEECEIVDAIPIPEGATNGDMIKIMFSIPDSEIDEGLSTTFIYTKTRVLKGGSQDYLRERITFNRDWWNAPYKEVEE